MLRLEEKKELVNDLKEKLSRSKILIATDYKGMNVEAITDLRKKLRESGVEYRVVKNTLLVRATEGTDFAVIKNLFKGPTAVAFSYDDPVAPAKVLTEFAKQNEKLEIKGAALDGRALDVNAIKALSSLPPKEILLAQMLGALNAVPTGFVRVLSAVPQSLLYVLQAIRDKKESAA